MILKNLKLCCVIIIENHIESLELLELLTELYSLKTQLDKHGINHL